MSTHNMFSLINKKKYSFGYSSYMVLCKLSSGTFCNAMGPSLKYSLFAVLLPINFRIGKLVGRSFFLIFF